MKKPSTNSKGENISNYVTDKELISKIYKQAISLSIKKPSNQVKKKKWTDALNRHFSKEEIQMTNRHIKTCSASAIIRELQIKTTKRYHLTPLKVNLLRCWWEYKLAQVLWKPLWRFLKKTKSRSTI